jgi:hypothetical protein
VLGRELINKESKAKLNSGTHLLTGMLSRGVNEKILEIQVQRLIDHQPVARIDRLGALRERGELIPLPQQSTPLGRVDPAPSSEQRYYPTAGELRQLYQASESAGDIAKMAEIKSLGVLLNEVYPDGDRAPDDFSHWVVEIPVPEQEIIETPSRSTAQEPTVIVPVNRAKNSIVVERSLTENIVGEAAPRGNRSM